MSRTKICLELLTMIKQQEEMIAKQNEIIAQLTNENLEKENMLNELLQQEEFLT